MSSLERTPTVLRRAEQWTARCVPDDATGCLIPPEQRHCRGYVTIEGHPQPLYRVLWVAQNGPIASGVGLRRTCETPECVAPEHRRFMGAS